jgi:hypothetical protein
MADYLNFALENMEKTDAWSIAAARIHAMAKIWGYCVDKVSDDTYKLWNAVASNKSNEKEEKERAEKNANDATLRRDKRADEGARRY